MRVDLRVKHDIVARKAAIGLFERGHGSESAAKALSVPRDTVRQWLYVYRSFGSEVLLSMDGKQARYTYEQKVAAASAVVDGGMARSSYYYALSHPKAPTRPELWEAAAEIFSRTANGCGHRQIAMCLRAERGVRIAYKTTLKMMREMGISCGIRRETDYHRYNSYRGKVGKTFENVIGRDFAADGPWEKMGTDVTEFKQPWGKAYFAPVYDFGSKEIVAWSTSLHPNMAQQHELLDQLVSRKPEGSRPILHSDMG